MKLINYNYGYIPLFTCSIHGKIKMTVKEWQDAYAYLLHPSVTKDFFRPILKEDVRRVQRLRNGNAILNVRVNATEKLVKRYSLQRYKRANYMIEIIPNP